MTLFARKGDRPTSLVSQRVQLVEQDACREDVALRRETCFVAAASVDHFGRRVARSPAPLEQVLGLVAARGQAEVDQLQRVLRDRLVSVLEQEVFGLEVPVNDVLRAQVGECCEDRLDDPLEVFHRETAAVLLQEAVQGRPFAQLEHQVDAVSRLLHLVQLHQVLVVELSREAHLVQQRLPTLLLRSHREAVEPLGCEPLACGCVFDQEDLLSSVYLRERAFPDLLQQSEPSEEVSEDGSRAEELFPATEVCVCAEVEHCGLPVFLELEAVEQRRVFRAAFGQELHAHESQVQREAGLQVLQALGQGRLPRRPAAGPARRPPRRWPTPLPRFCGAKPAIAARQAKSAARHGQDSPPRDGSRPGPLLPTRQKCCSRTL